MSIKHLFRSPSMSVEIFRTMFSGRKLESSQAQVFHTPDGTESWTFQDSNSNGRAKICKYNREKERERKRGEDLLKPKVSQTSIVS